MGLTKQICRECRNEYASRTRYVNRFNWKDRDDKHWTAGILYCYPLLREIDLYEIPSECPHILDHMMASESC